MSDETKIVLGFFVLWGFLFACVAYSEAKQCPPCEEISIIQRLHWACDAVLAESDGIDNDAPEVRGCFVVRGK